MKRSQANRAVIAARATPSTVNPDRRVSRNPAMRATTEVPVYEWTGTRRHGNKRTSKGGSSTGGVNGLWRTVSPTKRDSIQVDARWSVTVTDAVSRYPA